MIRFLTYNQIDMNGKIIRLTPRLYDLLYILSDEEEHSHESILRELFKGQIILATDSQTLRVHICYLRNRIGKKHIVTSPYGYRYVANP